MTGEPAIVGRMREFLAGQRRPLGPIVVAVSGGPDSVALLRALRDADAGPPGVAVVRPMLRVQRTDVLDYLNAIGQAYREDATNTDLARTRNRIRHELLPRLARDFNPRVVEALCRTATQAAGWRRDNESVAK